MPDWQAQDAGTRFGEIIDRAQTDGPQTIVSQGEEQAVVLSMKDYRALSTARPDFIAYLMGGPKVEDFDAPRDKDVGRPVDLCDTKHAEAIEIARDGFRDYAETFKHLAK